MRRYRGNMLLVELVITLIFFSISMVVIMQVFVTAQQKASESTVLSAALAQAEDIAEQLSVEDSPSAMLVRLGFMEQNGMYLRSDTLGYDLSVTLDETEGAAGRLTRAAIVAWRNGRELFSLPAARYLAGEAAQP